MTVHGALLTRESTVRAAPEEPTWPEAVQEGRALLARKARSFSLATAFLPRATQDDVAVLYGFCRIADDLADDAADGTEAARALERLEAELLGRAAPRPIVAGLRMLARRHGVSLQHAQTLLRGVRSDLGPVALEDDVALLRYCYRVAATVGLMLNRVLGVRGSAADACAVNLGLAMQITNIVRDVREDAAQGRVYLPRHRLATHGVSAGDVCAGRADRHAVLRVSLDLLELADQLYRQAASGLGFIPGRARFGISAAYRLYASIGWRIRRRGHQPLDGRMVVPAWEKAWRLAEAGAIALRHSVTAPAVVELERELRQVREAACTGA